MNHSANEKLRLSPRVLAWGWRFLAMEGVLWAAFSLVFVFDFSYGTSLRQVLEWAILLTLLPTLAISAVLLHARAPRQFEVKRPSLPHTINVDQRWTWSLLGGCLFLILTLPLDIAIIKCCFILPLVIWMGSHRIILRETTFHYREWRRHFRVRYDQIRRIEVERRATNRAPEVCLLIYFAPDVEEPLAVVQAIDTSARRSKMSRNIQTTLSPLEISFYYFSSYDCAVCLHLLAELVPRAEMNELAIRIGKGAIAHSGE